MRVCVLCCRLYFCVLFWLFFLFFMLYFVFLCVCYLCFLCVFSCCILYLGEFLLLLSLSFFLSDLSLVYTSSSTTVTRFIPHQYSLFGLNCLVLLPLVSQSLNFPFANRLLIVAVHLIMRNILFANLRLRLYYIFRLNTFSRLVYLWYWWYVIPLA